MSMRGAGIVAVLMLLGCERAGGSTPAAAPESASAAEPAPAAAPAATAEPAPEAEPASSATAAAKTPRTVDVVLAVREASPAAVVAHWLDPSGPPSPALAGARVCVHDHPEVPCVTTGEDGVFTLKGVPAESELTLTLTHDGFVPQAVALITDRLDHRPDPAYVNLPMLRPAWLAQALPPGLELDPERGHVAAWVLGPGDAPMAWNVEREVSVSLAAPAGSGPHFANADGRFARGAKTTRGGHVYFANLPPGDHVVRLVHPKKLCELAGIGANPPWLFWGHLSDDAVAGGVSIRAPVLPGHLTTVGAYCP